MAMRKMLVILSLGWLAQSACAVEPINGKNWNTHPSIVEIRAIYTDIVQALDAGKLKKQERKFITENCHHEKDTVRTLYTDAQGIHRLFQGAGGSEDSKVHRSFFYDVNGKLRFSFIRGGASDGTVLEYRIYFSPEGKKIWSMKKKTGGPGYTFPDEWSEEDFVRDPLATFNEADPCL